MSIGGCVCGSTNCKKYNICKRAICEEVNKQYYVTNWHSYGSANCTDNGIEEAWCCGEHGNYAMFIPLDESVENKNKVMDNKIYVKEDRLDVHYDSGELEDGTAYNRPCLTVARYNRYDITIENRFYDDEAVELYKKLTDRKYETTERNCNDTSSICNRLTRLINEYKEEQKDTDGFDSEYFAYEEVIYDLEVLLGEIKGRE